MGFVFMLLGGLGRFLRAIADFVARNPLLAGCIALGLLSAFLWRADHRHLAQRDKARTEYKAFRVAVEQKAAEALAAQIAVNKAKEREYVEAADDAQDSYDSLRALYAERLRVKAGGGASRVASAPASTGDPRLPENTPAPAQYILSADDALKLPALQAYADACFVWAKALSATNGP